MTPPSHINVLRTALSRVDTVPFRRYVEIVMAGEWGAENPREALAAGAVAVKQYAWYYAMAGNWRGGSVGGRCYDVRDSTADQVYRPATKVPAARHLAAVAESWSVTVRKPNGTSRGRFFATQYNNGSDYRRCGTGLTGHTLRQVGASSCAAAGYSFRQILRLYYGPGARVVSAAATPPAVRHDLDGKGAGDIGLLLDREVSPTADAPTTDAVVLSSDGKHVKTRSDQPLGFSLGAVLSHVTADLSGDRRPDLAILSASDHGPEISVFTSGDDGLAPAAAWWDGGGLSQELSYARLELIAGRWEQGGRPGLGLVVQFRDGGRPAKIYEVKATGDGARQAVLVWQGDPGGIVWDAYAGDFTGDGRADVALVVDAGTNGIRLLVLPGSGSHGALKAPQRWAADTELVRSDAVPLPADVDGDGRSDVVMAERLGEGGVRFVAYRSTGRSFERIELGNATAGYPWQQVVFGVSDLNADARDDVYVLVPDGDAARVDAFLSRGKSLTHATWGSAAEIDLASATTY